VSGPVNRYRFGPRDRRGLIAGVRAGQVAVVAASLVVAVAMVRDIGRGIGLLLACVVVAVAIAAAWVPIGGRTPEQWIPVAGRYAIDVVLGRRTSILERGSSSDGQAPAPFAAFEVTEQEGLGVHGRFGALHDRRSGTWTAVLCLGSESFALLGEDDRARRVATWSGVLAAVAGGATRIHRLQWIERTVPDSGEQLRRFAQRVAPAGLAPAIVEAQRSYAELVDRESPGVLRHELFLACTLRCPAARVGELAGEIAQLDRRCRDAGLPVDGVLSRAGLASLLRRGFDPMPITSLSSWPWPVAVETSWTSIRTDGTWHATYWVAEWPRSDVASDFLLPLLVSCAERRTVTVVMSAIPPERAIRAAEHARTSTTSDAALRQRHGFATSARRSREQEAVVRREGELAEGHAAYRFSGYVTVTVDKAAKLEAACARIEQAAALSRLELRRLYGTQAEALTFTLPTGRGCS